MKFCEAMEMLKTGSKMTRSVWTGSLYFLLDKDGKGISSYQPRFLDYSYDEDIMISDGWMVEGQESTMLFCETIPFLEDGKKARMADWDDAYIYLDRGEKKLVIYSMQPFPFVPDFASFAANDWMI